ncbi:hypothetical protein [Gluconobacter morbifer]|uniref:Uncharacterized protein n=1 Tax=Gluconobacter morbifer G707 TaxID=1088869 RepID=G6XKW7_9PROT|nr:hypothetical protein [Gluconobacter morbifer]EHH67562.1 hypothetical protein GMO_21330 [Gluconobacter morbifer G707]
MSRSKLSVSTDGPSVEDNRPKLPEGCSWQNDGSVLMVLGKSVPFTESSSAGERQSAVSELVFRDLSAGDMIDMSEYRTPGERTLFLMCASTGRVGPAGEALLRKMSARDYLKAGAIINVFTSAGPTTGTSA